MKRDTKPIRVRDILEGMLSRNERLKYEVKIREALNSWSDIAEVYVRAHTKAVYVKNRTLYVNTESSVLANELSLREKEYIRKLNSAAGIDVIKKIVFKAGNTIYEKNEGREKTRPGGRLSMNVLKKIDTSVLHIKEGDLREIFRRFLRTTAGHNEKK